jgi:hypothetical protein
MKTKLHTLRMNPKSTTLLPISLHALLENIEG